jgi:hypothetical protein
MAEVEEGVRELATDAENGADATDGPCEEFVSTTDLPVKGSKKRKMQKNRESMRQKIVQN